MALMCYCQDIVSFANFYSAISDGGSIQILYLGRHSSTVILIPITNKNPCN